MAMISLDFILTLTCPNVTALAETQALTKWMAYGPRERSWERRTVSPSMATTSPWSI